MLYVEVQLLDPQITSETHELANEIIAPLGDVVIVAQLRIVPRT